MQVFIDFKGQINPRDRYAIVASRWHHAIVDRLIQGSEDYLSSHGGTPDQCEILRVPGAFEIGQAAQWAIQSKRFDGIVLLGCIIKGETSHYEVLAHAVLQSAQTLSTQAAPAVTCGILTADTLAQAQARAGLREQNKGWEATAAMIEMLELHRHLQRNHHGA